MEVAFYQGAWAQWLGTYRTLEGWLGSHFEPATEIVSRNHYIMQEGSNIRESPFHYIIVPLYKKCQLKPLHRSP